VEELIARPRAMRSPDDALPRLAAMRLGARWSADSLEFLGAVSLIASAEISEVSAILYWTSISPGDRSDLQSITVSIQWRDPLGRKASEESVVATNSLVSWSRLPASLTPLYSQKGNATGTWRVEVFAGAQRIGNTTFYVYSDSSANVAPGLAQRYFRLQPSAI